MWVICIKMLHYFDSVLLHKKQCRVNNSYALTGKKPCINKAIHAPLMHINGAAMQLSICLYRGHRFAAVTRCVLSGPGMSIVRGNYLRETSVKRRNKIVQECEM